MTDIPDLKAIKADLDKLRSVMDQANANLADATEAARTATENYVNTASDYEEMIEKHLGTDDYLAASIRLEVIDARIAAAKVADKTDS